MPIPSSLLSLFLRMTSEPELSRTGSLGLSLCLLHQSLISLLPKLSLTSKNLGSLGTLVNAILHPLPG